ncbi:MAG: type II secretion system F family protein [Gaiellales bacterium]|nr:type II secretion system F family protein [Gaiellales bacterium]
MATYEYTARPPQGSPVKGIIDGASKMAAAAELRRRGLTVLALDEKRTSLFAGLDEKMQSMSRIKLRDKVVFSRQFATMIGAGLAILRALYVLESQTQNARFKHIISLVKADVEAGLPISDAMEKHPAAFDRLYVSMVRAGETGGVLDVTLDRLATQLEKQDSLQRTVKSAMAYPTLIGVFSILVLIGMILFIIPIFADMFDQLGGELPGLTRAMVGISDFLKGWWFVIIPCVVGLVLGLRYLKRTPQGAAAWDRFKLHIPMRIGEIVQKLAVARFSRTLATLASSGVPILQSLDITGKTAGNVVIERAMEQTKAKIRGGESIARPLEEAKVFPPMVTHMIAIGEETGALDNMLHKIADFYEDEVDAVIKQLTSILEPVMMIFVGGMVGVIVISMYLPMFSMMDLVK